MHPGHTAYGVTGRQWGGNSPPHLPAAPTPKPSGTETKLSGAKAFDGGGGG